MLKTDPSDPSETFQKVAIKIKSKKRPLEEAQASWKDEEKEKNGQHTEAKNGVAPFDGVTKENSDSVS